MPAVLTVLVEGSLSLFFFAAYGNQESLSNLAAGLFIDPIVLGLVWLAGFLLHLAWKRRRSAKESKTI